MTISLLFQDHYVHLLRTIWLRRVWKLWLPFEQTDRQSALRMLGITLSIGLASSALLPHLLCKHQGR